MGLILHPREIQVRDVMVSRLHTSIIRFKYFAVNLVVLHSAVILGAYFRTEVFEMLLCSECKDCITKTCFR